jgi:hypothetical protein
MILRQFASLKQPELTEDPAANGSKCHGARSSWLTVWSSCDQPGSGIPVTLETYRPSGAHDSLMVRSLAGFGNEMKFCSALPDAR